MKFLQKLAKLSITNSPVSFRHAFQQFPQKLSPHCFDTVDRVTCKSIINNARRRCQFIQKDSREMEDFVKGKVLLSSFSPSPTRSGGPKTIL